MYMCVIMSLPWEYIHCTAYKKRGGRDKGKEGRKGMEVKKGRREGVEVKRERREQLELWKLKLTWLRCWWFRVCKDKICPMLQFVKL